MPSRIFRWAIILCRFNNISDETRPIEYYQDFFTQNGAGGVCDYWRDVTFNNWDLSESQVFGWFEMDHSTMEVSSLHFPYGRTVLVQWGRDAAAANNVDLSGFDRVLVIQNSHVDHGATGNGDVIIAHSHSGVCEFGFICHEMGHGHGLPHSWAADGLANIEYGDRWDLMSFDKTTDNFKIRFQGASGDATVGINAPNLQKLEAVPPRRTWTPPQPDFSSGPLTLDALNQSPMGNRGFLVADILPGSTIPARANNSRYTVEYRRNVGWDRSVPHDAVLIHEVRSNGLSFLPSSGHNLDVNERFITPDPKVFVRMMSLHLIDTASVWIWDIPEGSLRKEEYNPKVYMIDGGQKRWITSEPVLFALGKSWGDVRVVPNGGLDDVPDGPDLNLLSITVTPLPMPVNRQVSVKFTVKDVGTGNAVAGKVKSNGVVIGDTNAQFSYNFKTVKKRVGGQWEVIYPVITVSVPKYADVIVDVGFP